MNSTGEPLVSILTPVYNGGRYLRGCIESVLRQTYQNWEYIIVNNCSTDETAAIAAEYAARDSRIRVVTNEKNVGCEPNHNIAFRQISPASKYCKVVHADDELLPDCLEKMLEVALAHPSIGMVSSYCLYTDGMRCVGLPYPETFFPGREVGRAMFFRKYHVIGSPTDTLIRADFLRNKEPFYNENNTHADTEAGFGLLAQADLGFVHQVLTYSRVHENSETSCYSSPLDTKVPSRLEIVQKHGRKFLTEEEYGRFKSYYEREYYSLIARRLVGLGGFRGRRYWDYHRRRLREIGLALSKIRLTIAVLCLPYEIVRHFLFPKRWLPLPRALRPGRSEITFQKQEAHP